jgi:uncharacterized circularly permuted ATP-grasp superfamily protein/uncharacterized alpha-E superfamily protein
VVKETGTESVKSRVDEWRYTPIEGHWDEALLPSGFPRRHWRKLAVSLMRMGFRQFSRSWQTGHQLIQANGITYNVSTDPQGKERPWPMDPIPLVLAGEDWAYIERAVIQRATLLNAILSDLYHEQRLVHERHFPAPLVFANPHFLRPCHGIAPAGGAHLHTYAVDLARSPDGGWWVLSDRAQAPSGIGYALENRLVSARTLPGVFNQCRVRQLTRFFEAKRNALMALAPARRDTPRIVLLTPGPHNETYFEHSFLAGHWGFPLVEGADLTVRDQRVYLKTLAGLEPVDVILRRMDDGYCDPLELRGDSLLGVPGLVQAVRSGSVAIDNALGSGLLEAPALMAFLPGLCRQLLGEELMMPSVATWWGGQKEPCRYVLDHLDQLVIKPAFRRFGRHSVIPALMDASGREEIARKIESHPDQYVAQERVAVSTVPVRTDQGLAARPMLLRVFAAWDGDSYIVLPGGLTRVSTEGAAMVSMQLGAGSKDTWVLGGPEEAPFQARPAPISLNGRYNRPNLPSRVADNLFWLGRYAERVESGVRLIRALLPALSGEEDFGRTASLETVVRLLAGLHYLPSEASLASLAQQRWRVQRLLSDVVYDPARTSGLGWNLKQMRRVAWHVKERLSADTWRVLQQIESEFSRPAPTNPDQRMAAEMSLLDGIIVTLSAFAGLVMENTTRGLGWRFLDIGRRLERTLMLSELLRAGVAEAPAEIEPYLQTLLHIADSSITYRTRFLTLLRTDLVLDLLLADETNPRSIGFQLVTLLDHIENLPQHEADGRHSLEERLVMKVLTAVRLEKSQDLERRDENGRLAKLESLIQLIKTDLYDLSDALTAQYLSHIEIARVTSSD